jgi:Fur family transcriptional regulator, peroxide stress response regulator
MAMQHGGSRERLERFERLCRAQGLPVTVQRRTVLEVVLGREDHPTADQIYAEVLGRLAGVSRTTVYRVLDMLVRFGVITKACHPGAVARFDGNTDHHHHLVCLHCDKVIDLVDEQLDAIKLPDARHLGFEVTDLRVQLYGVCAECRDKAIAAETDATTTDHSSASKRQETRSQAPEKRKKRL